MAKEIPVNTIPNSVVQARFIERDACVGCEGKNLVELSSGRYQDEPLRGYIAGDPWGEEPLPHLVEARWRFMQCRDCSQKFHGTVLDEEWNERRFTEWMSADAITEFEQRMGDVARRKFDYGRECIGHVLSIERLTRPVRDESKSVRVLDFGCGWGGFLAAAQGFGFEVVGVDRSVARREGSKIPIYASPDDLAPEARFHAITLFEALEHLDAPLQVLRDLAKRLVPGGVLVLETPDCTGVKTIASHDDYRKIHPLEHINGFTPESMKTIAERAGFRWIDRGNRYVTADLVRVAKDTVNYVIGRDGTMTRMYFRKA